MCPLVCQTTYWFLILPVTSRSEPGLHHRAEAHKRCNNINELIVYAHCLKYFDCYGETVSFCLSLLSDPFMSQLDPIVGVIDEYVCTFCWKRIIITAPLP